MMLLVAGTMLGLAVFASVAHAVPGFQTQMDSLQSEAQELQAQMDYLDQQLEKSSEAYNQLVVSLNELNVTMTMLREQQDAAEVDYRYRLRLYENRLCDLYKAGGRDEFLEMILDAGDMGDFLSRAALAAELADQDRRLMENLTQSADRLDSIIADIDRTKSQELIIRRQMEQEHADIQTALAARQAALLDIDSQMAAAIAEEQQHQAEEQERLRQALNNMLNGGQVYYGTLPETESEILDEFLETAAAYLGVTYVWGGDRPSTGMDCSGYTQFVYRQHGVKLPHYSGYQAVLGLPVDRADIRPGDLLAFGFPVHHVGIYIGDDMFIHAAGTGSNVRIGRLSQRTDVAAIRRFDLKHRSGAPAFY
jgi:cell wall-associated NlpC family hydrolase